MKTIQQQARHAGLLYLLLALSAPIGLMVVPGRIIVRHDATATADHLRASEWLMRLGIGSELLHQALVIFVVMALYRLFRGVDRHQAQLLVILGALVSVPIMFLNVVNQIAALTLVSGTPYLNTFDKAQLDTLAYLFVRLHSTGIQVASIFWGLWLFPFGWLAIRSGFIPRVFGWLLYVAGAAYLVNSTAVLCIPAWAPGIGQVTGILIIAEVPIIFWLAIAGANGPRAKEALPA